MKNTVSLYSDRFNVRCLWDELTTTALKYFVRSWAEFIGVLMTGTKELQLRSVRDVLQGF
jgi:hypothetical protein